MSRSTRWRVAAAAALGLALSGCAVAAAGVVVAGIGVAVVSFSCDDPVSVTVWDRATGHTLCDASVVAERDGDRVPFSPCYRAFVDEGTWKVTATKPGHAPATGTVVVTRPRGCQPVYHTVELTLAPEGFAPPAPPAATSPAPAGVTSAGRSP